VKANDVATREHEVHEELATTASQVLFHLVRGVTRGDAVRVQFLKKEAVSTFGEQHCNIDLLHS
jgi:hypothetical protein